MSPKLSPDRRFAGVSCAPRRREPGSAERQLCADYSLVVADAWRYRWACLTALQERIEQHATGRNGTPIDADADFASFLVESENLRDGVKKECERRSLASPHLVDAQVRSVISLQLAHDLAIKVKHEKQTRENRGLPRATPPTK